MSLVTSRTRVSVPDVFRYVAVILYIGTFVFGVVGNTLTIVILAGGGGAGRKMKRSMATLFILNLAIADDLFVICLPLKAHATFFRQWVFGLALCKILNVFKSVNLFASIFTMTVMSIDRYLAVVHPLNSLRYRTTRHATHFCILIWLLCFITTTPLWIYSTTTPSDSHVSVPKSTSIISGALSRVNLNYTFEFFSSPVTPSSFSSAPNNNSTQKTSSGDEQCRMIWPKNSYFERLWVYFELLVGFILPIFIMTVSYSLVIKRVLQPRTAQEGGAQYRCSFCCVKPSMSADQNQLQHGPDTNHIPILATNRCVLYSKTSPECSAADTTIPTSSAGEYCKNEDRSENEQRKDCNRKKKIRARRHQGDRSSNTSRVTYMIFMVTVIFIVCWTPYHVSHLLVAHRQDHNQSRHQPELITNKSVIVHESDDVTKDRRFVTLATNQERVETPVHPRHEFPKEVFDDVTAEAMTILYVHSFPDVKSHSATGGDTFDLTTAGMTETILAAVGMEEMEETFGNEVSMYMIMSIFVQVLPFVSSCCNPFIYYITSSNFQRKRSNTYSMRTGSVEERRHRGLP